MRKLIKEIVIATHNLHKVREFRQMFKGYPHVDVLSLSNFPSYRLPKETGKTFQDNAELKAKHAAKALKKWVLADDSGLVVPKLEGRPGVFSRRYAGEEATDGDNRQKLLSEMKDLQELDRSAYFECVLALASPKGIEKIVHGIVEGTIAFKEKGRHGFGYDAIFIKHDYDITLGEVEEAIKNRISHRRKAFDKLASYFQEILASEEEVNKETK